jgi:phosphoglycolate phosphatase
VTASGTSLVVFDLDGTLVDSLRDLAESTNALIARHGGHPHSDEAIGRMVGEGAATLVARAFAASAIAEPPDALQQFLAIYNQRALRWTRPYEGVERLLDSLASRVNLAVLTNKPLGATTEILEGLGLARYFGASVVGGDGPLGRKPDPAGLLHFMEAARTTAAATMMVGDSLVDFRTARACGARVCMARYGFGFASFPAAELERRDLAIDRPLDLLECL